MTNDSKLDIFYKDVVIPRAKYAWDLFWIIVLYGFLISFSLSQILPTRFRFTIASIFAWGIAFYFIKEEIPRIILKMQQPKRSHGRGNDDF